ncbi:MAG: glutamyl-tRNA reductase [Deltaproteobacteria bacterium]|nr:glutamyl-tRNA reductase [Deltaproteobacteria bacterium]|tara:strand:- start:11106 stop:12278 length:1173 start_codon:yes stop_codon:yes gene_type:complete
MDRLALIGVAHRRGGIEALEFWNRKYGSFTHRQFLDMGFAEVTILSTCNRFELAVVLEEDDSFEAAKHRLMPEHSRHCYVFSREGCVEQLARIASSLDSLNPGEDQIMMQMRESFAQAQQEKAVGKELNFAFSTAFRIAKRIRREVRLAPLNTSLFSLARPAMESHLPQQAKVGIVGVGEIGQLAAKVMAERPETHITLINRSVEKAEKVAAKMGEHVEAMALSQFLETTPPLDAFISAVSVESLFSREQLQEVDGLRVIVDMGLPRNVAPGTAQALGVPLFDVETLQQAGQERRRDLEEQLIFAEDVLLEELDLAIGEWIERQLGPSIKALRMMYIEKAKAFVSEKDASRLANQLAKGPIKGLRVMAREHGLQAAKTFLEAADIFPLTS